MKTNEPTIDKVAPYLPYGVRILNGNEPLEVKGICVDPTSEEWMVIATEYLEPVDGDNSIHHFSAYINEIEFLFRPLSDLYKEIEYNGQKIIPLIELAKMQPYFNENKFYEINDHSDHTEFKTGKPQPYYEVWYESDINKSMPQTFVFCLDTISFESAVIFGFGTKDFKMETVPTDNQLQLFQKLFEWKFDVFGGIQEGWAIDINTI